MTSLWTLRNAGWGLIGNIIVVRPILWCAFVKLVQLHRAQRPSRHGVRQGWRSDVRVSLNGLYDWFRLYSPAALSMLGFVGSLEKEMSGSDVRVV